MLPLWSLSDTNRQENQLLIEALMSSVQIKSVVERKHDVPALRQPPPPPATLVSSRQGRSEAMP
jgi:hypothetical protein